MTFVGIPFLVFFAVFLILYRLLARNLLYQNGLLLAGSYVFYGWWDWRFLLLLCFTSTVDYAAGIYMDRAPSRWRRLGVICSICSNLTVLFFFKYFNFFVESTQTLLSQLGMHTDRLTIEIILPIGLSFYTFQSLAYTIDVYRGRATAEYNPLTFYAYLAFFPQLVAGPIERPEHLLSQFRAARSVSSLDLEHAIWLIIWGYFLKVVVGDGAAPLADAAFSKDPYYGWTVVIGTLAFAVQIYGDFCGYSLIAKGVAHILGFDLMWNFNRPYWATSIRDFWRRWHISLSTWLRDYLYISLGGNRKGPFRTYLNLFLTMTLGGLWHGAAWTFFFWGMLHGLALAVERVIERLLGKWHLSVPLALGWLSTMAVVLVGWFLFRARSWDVVLGARHALDNMEWTPGHGAAIVALLALALPVFLVEFWQSRTADNYCILRLGSWPVATVSAILVVCILAMLGQHRSEFIYFQF
jgi:D-alanyl-lipoteichoic acid acyltransferase DltB (MBOAT superfamily)